MAVRETSLEAYRSIESSGVLGAQERTILLAMHSAQRPDYSLRELELLTGIRISSISGRCHKLKSEAPRWLEEAPKRLCSITRRTVVPLRLRMPKVQGDLFGSER